MDVQRDLFYRRQTVLLGLVVLASFSEAVFGYLGTFLIRLGTAKMMNRLQISLFEAGTTSSMDLFDDVPPGEYISYVSEVEMLEELVMNRAEAFQHFLFIFAGVVYFLSSEAALGASLDDHLSCARDFCWF